jgi:hypothetical protein
MAATATARSTAPARRVPTRRAPARKATARKPATGRAPARPAKRRRSQQTPFTGFVPVAVGRTAGAVGGLADSPVVVRLTRGRWWIGLLGALLVGIVALNVMALSFSASSSNAGRQADELKRQNSALRAQIATRLSNDEIQAAATGLGLFLPEAGQVSYVRPSPDDAAEAARRLRAGELGFSDYAPVQVTPVAPTEAVPTEAVPTEAPPVTDPAATAPETTVPADPIVPAAPETVPPATGGGVASP